LLFAREMAILSVLWWKRHWDFKNEPQKTTMTLPYLFIYIYISVCVCVCMCQCPLKRTFAKLKGGWGRQSVGAWQQGMFFVCFFQDFSMISGIVLVYDCAQIIYHEQLQMDEDFCE